MGAGASCDEGKDENFINGVKERTPFCAVGAWEGVFMTVESSRGVIFIVFMDFFNSFLCSDVIIVRESKSAGR